MPTLTIFFAFALTLVSVSVSVSVSASTAALPYTACDVVSVGTAFMAIDDLRRCTAACTLATVEARLASRTAPTDFEHHPFGLGGWGRARARPFSVYQRDVPQDRYAAVRGYDNGRLECAMEHTLAGHDPDLKHRTYYPSAAALWASVPLVPPPKRCFRRVLREDIRPCSDNSWLQCKHAECQTVSSECDTDWVKRAPYSEDFAQAARDLEELRVYGVGSVPAAADADHELACGVANGNWTALLWKRDGTFRGWGTSFRLPCVAVDCEVQRQCVRHAQAMARAAYPDTLSARDVAQAAAGHPYAPATGAEDLLYENALARQFWPKADIPGAVAAAQRIQAQYNLEKFAAVRARGPALLFSHPWYRVC